MRKNTPRKDPVLYENCFFIAGPTASGKSALAIAVAELTGAEIVGADAFQIYSGWRFSRPQRLRRIAIKYRTISWAKFRPSRVSTSASI